VECDVNEVIPDRIESADQVIPSWKEKNVLIFYCNYSIIYFFHRVC
jgi:hypothetical protein